MKKNSTLLVALVVLLGIYFLVERDSSSTSVPDTFVELNAANISSVSFTKTGKTLTVSKLAGRWVINNYPADTANIGRAVRAISDIKLSRFVTDNTERQTGFEVNDEKGIKVDVTHGDATASFYVGKQASSYKSIFVRKDGENAIYSTKSNFRSLVDKSEFDWKDKRIVAIPKEQITSVELVQGSSRVIVQNRDSLNMVYGNNAASEPEAKGNFKAGSVLSSLGSLNTTAFHAAEAASFDAPDAVVNVTQVGGAVVELRLKKKDENAYFVSLKGNPQVFELAKATAENFLRSYADLKE